MQKWWCSFIFSVLDGKHSFWANLVQNIKIVSLSLNQVPGLIRIWRIQWRCSLFLFQMRNTLFGQIWSKNQTCQLKLKFSTQNNSKYVEFNGGFQIFCFRLETPFLGKFGQKNQNCQFKLKFVTQTNSNMQNSMALFTFSILDQKHPFW